MVKRSNLYDLVFIEAAQHETLVSVMVAMN